MEDVEIYSIKEYRGDGAQAEPTAEQQQSQYINMFRAEGKNAVILRHNIDGAFVTHVERANETVHFQRIDADLTDDFKEIVSQAKEIFEREINQ